MEMKAKVHYYSKLNRGGRFSLSEVGKGNRLRPKVMINLWIMEAVALPTSVNRLTEAGSLQCPPRLIDKKQKILSLSRAHS
jgi:hypothetical protein